MFGFAYRLADHPGSVARAVAEQVAGKLATAPTTEPPTVDTDGVPQVASLDEVRALRNAARAKRYPAAKYGETKFVSVDELGTGV